MEKDWSKRCALMMRATSSKGKKAFLGSVLAQLNLYSGRPTQAQAALLEVWWRHYLKKTKTAVVEAAEEGVDI